MAAYFFDDFAGVLGMLQLVVCTKCFIDPFGGFRLRTLGIGHGLFDAYNLTALRALAEQMTSIIHFNSRSKPFDIGQFGFFHDIRFPTCDYAEAHGVTSGLVNSVSA